jgi:hypothetical protein
MAYPLESQNFDGVTAPALPGTWTGNAAYDTSTAQVQSSPNALHQATAASVFRTFYYNTLDGNEGDVRVAATMRNDNGAASCTMGVIARATDPEGAASTMYFGRVKFTFGLELFRRVSATNTQLGSTVAGAFSKTGWYILTLTLSGSDITLRAQRVSDGFYLNSAGTWDAAEADAFSTTDTNITGEGYAGIFSNLSGSAGDVYIDNFLAEIDDPATTTTGSGWERVKALRALAARNTRTHARNTRTHRTPRRAPRRKPRRRRK